MEVGFCFVCGRCKANDGIQKQFYTIAQCSGTTHYGSDGIVFDTIFQTIVDFFFCQFNVIEEFFHEFVAAFCCNFYQHGTQNFYFVLFIFRHFAGLQFAVYFLSGISLDQIDEANEFAICIIERNLQRCNGFTEFHTHVCQCTFKVRIFIVHLVYKENTRQMHFFGIFPCFFSTNFYAGFCGNHDQGCIRYAHSQFGFSHEVKITRCIQEVDLCILPFYRQYGCTDRYLTANFFWIVVTNGIAFVHFSESFCCSGIEQRCFGISGFPRTAVTQ